MRKRWIMVASVFAAAALAVVAPVAPGDQRASKEAQGGFKLSVHTHSSDNPIDPRLLFPTDRLSYDFVEGEDFSYSSRTCGGRAPFNDLGLDFSPDYPGVDDDDGTAAVRHHVEGTITEVNGDRGTVEGTITSVLCENGEETEHSIVTHFVAKYRRVSDNEVQITGKFALSPTESTGTFKDITGRGSIKGVLTCLGHERNPSLPTCKQLGYFTDFVGLRGDTSKPPGDAVPGLMGSYRDPTVEPL